MDDHHDEVRFERVASKGVSRAVPIATFLIGIFIGAAVVKPWDLLFPAGSTPVDRSPPVVAVASPTTPVPTPSPKHAPAECAFAGGWRIFALGQRDRLGGDGSTVGGAAPTDGGGGISDIGNPLRRWLEVIPVDDVAGPEDATIPFVTIVSSSTTAIGYCPPPNDLDGPPEAAVFEAWRIDDAGKSIPMFLEPVVPKGSVVTEVVVYIGQRDADDGRWAAGRYVFALATPDGGYERWFGLEIRTPPGRPTD